MRRLRPVLALCLGVLLALSGCGEPEPVPTPTSSPEPSPTQTPQPSARFSLGYDPAASLHPITGESQVNQELTGLVYQGLYELDNTFTPQPVLAQSAAVSGDGLAWTFTLKPGAAFSDGTPLTAQHGADSLNAARAAPLYAQRLASVTGAAAGEDGTLTVTLSAPNGNLPALLDIPIVLEQEDGSTPLGTGYYRYEAAGDSLLLRANPHNASASVLPYDAIPLAPASDPAGRIAAFDSGGVSAVTTDFTSPYALGYSSSYETADFPTTTLLYVGFRASGGMCRSPLARRAFSLALDREAAVRSDLLGHGDPAALPVSPLSGEYSQSAADALSFDLEQAAALLEQAGYEKGEDGLLYQGKAPAEVTLLVNSDNDVRQAIAGRLAQALEELGVTVTVNRLPWSGYTAALAGGQFDLYLGEVRLTGDFDPSALLSGGLNYGGFSGGELSALLSDWRAARGDARTRAGEALWTRFAQDAPFAPVCFKRGSLLLRWGMASNLNPTRANPYYKMDQWITAG